MMLFSYIWNENSRSNQNLDTGWKCNIKDYRDNILMLR